jgi:hypothetical protein
VATRTVYEVTAAPPLELGAVQETTDWVEALLEAVTDDGAPGIVAGVAGVDGEEYGPVPSALTAATSNS